jgi:glycosyltransferase involved in cell wall biosynthesis
VTALIKVMAYPRDPNPHEEDLYDEIERLGALRRYVGELTRSHGANLLLLPAELCVRRVQGYRILHLHWFFAVQLSGPSRGPFLRRLARWYLIAVVQLCSAAGIAVVWTAHNGLAHEPCVDDDVFALQQLTTLCSAVIAHSPATIAALAAMGCEIRRVAVIPPGAPKLVAHAAPLSRNGDQNRVRALFIGRIEVYRGVEDLLNAVASPNAPEGLELVVAGECRDAALATRLSGLVAKSRVRVEMRIGKLSDDQLARELARADLVVLPFRDVTSSGSVDLALAAARPVLIPAISALAGVPAACAWRYDGTTSGLIAALSDAVRTPPERRFVMSEAAQRYASQRSWPIAARATYELYSDVLRLSAEKFRGKKIQPRKAISSKDTAGEH